MTMVSQDAAQRWIARWDRQQEGYVPEREDRFTTLIDAVELTAGRDDPLVVDLGCGPGSLAVRLLERLPRATVVAVDADPLLLELGRAAYDGPGDLRFVELDLGRPGWTERLGLDRPADAAVSTTALHWMSPDGLRAMYAELSGVLRPGGVLLDGDNLRIEDEAPTLARLEADLYARRTARRFGPDRPEEWTTWWEALAADPALSALSATQGANSDSSGHHGSPSALLSTHVSALNSAGFTEIGPLWQHGNDRILCAIKPA